MDGEEAGPTQLPKYDACASPELGAYLTAFMHSFGNLVDQLKATEARAQGFSLWRRATLS